MTKVVRPKKHAPEPKPIHTRDGKTIWYFKWKIHREDGPAIIHLDGTKEWWLNDLHHREGAPATEYPDGGVEWWFKGEQMSFKDYLALDATDYPKLQVLQIMHS